MLHKFEADDFRIDFRTQSFGLSIFLSPCPKLIAKIHQAIIPIHVTVSLFPVVKNNRVTHFLNPSILLRILLLSHYNMSVYG